MNLRQHLEQTVIKPDADLVATIAAIKTESSIPMCCKGAMKLTYMAAHGIPNAVMVGSEKWECSECGNELPYR